MEATANRIEPGRVIGEAFQTYRDHAGALLGGAVIVIGLAAVINGLFATTGSLALVAVGVLVSIVAGVLYAGYVVKLVQDVRDGRRDFSVGELFSAAAPYIGTLFLNGLLAGIAITIGFVLIIVPGLILITIWSVIAPSIVVRGPRGDRGVRPQSRARPRKRLERVRRDRARLSDRDRRLHRRRVDRLGHR